VLKVKLGIQQRKLFVRLKRKPQDRHLFHPVRVQKMI
jgi:hypothetical protein